MKFHYPLLFAAALLNQVSAQVPPVVVEEVVEVAPAGGTVMKESVTESVIPHGVVPGEVVTEQQVVPRRLDAALARRQLAILPRPVPADAVPAPGSVVETTETTTTVETPGLPPRVYIEERNVVLVEGRELPYLTIPVLFVKETDELLDVESRQAIEETAGAIREVTQADPTARFDIEGHTSTEGTDEFNMELSAKRARRVYAELTQRYKIPSDVLTAHGYGENFPKHPSGTEEQLTLDRRVLVVRVK